MFHILFLFPNDARNYILRKIFNNSFPFRFREDREARKMRCECQYTSGEIEAGVPGCVEGCLNRMLYIECGVKCSAKDNCTNKRFQRVCHTTHLLFVF